MASFTSIPQTVEAVQLTKESRSEAKEFIGTSGKLGSGLSGKVYTSAGSVAVASGDWIIKHADGSLSVMKADAFKQNYGKSGGK